MNTSPTDDMAYNVFRDLMRHLISKSKEELMQTYLNPETPDFIRNIIHDHPALLGGCITEKPSVENGFSAE
jgi:hypothetical protein